MILASAVEYVLPPYVPPAPPLPPAPIDPYIPYIVGAFLLLAASVSIAVLVKAFRKN